MSKSSAIGERRIAQRSLGTVYEFEVMDEVFFFRILSSYEKTITFAPALARCHSSVGRAKD